MRFSLSFIPVVIAARIFGIGGAVAVYGMGDFLGAVLFPTGGAFQVGFTLTAAISGLIYGLWLGRSTDRLFARYFRFDRYSIIRKVMAVLTSQVVCSLFLNSFWLSFYYGMPFWARLATRVPQIVIIGGLQIVFMVLFLDKICKALRKAGI